MNPDIHIVARRILVAAPFALLFLASCAVTSERPIGYKTIWSRTLVDGAYQLPQALIRTSNGGYATAGFGFVDLVPGGIGVNTGFWTVRLNREGQTTWQGAFAAQPPKRREEGRALVQTSDGGLLVVGETGTESLAGSTFGEPSKAASTSCAYCRVGLAIKYDVNGVIQWKRIIGGSDEKPSDWFYAAGATASGYVLVGTTSLSLENKKTIWALRVVKLDDAGIVVWDRTIHDGASSIEVESVSRKVVTTSDGGFFIASAPSGGRDESGRTMDIASDDGARQSTLSWQRVVLRKFDSDGNVVARAEIQEATDHLALGSNANGYIVSGYRDMLWYALFDENLNLKWRKRPAHAMKINAFVPAPDGGFYGVGATSKLSIAHISRTGQLRQQEISAMPRNSEGRDVVIGDAPDELVILWSRIAHSKAGLVKLQVPVAE